MRLIALEDTNVNQPDHRSHASAGISMRAFASLFLASECIGALLWWIAIAISPDVRAVFTSDQFTAQSLAALAPADLLVFCGSAAAAAWAVARRAPWERAAVVLHLGAAWYAALLAIGLSAAGSMSWAAGALMAPSLVVTPLIAAFIGRSRSK